MVDDRKNKPSWTDHPLFKQGLAHFETAEWEEAISLFSELSAEFPEDEELQQLLADLRLKASSRERAGRAARVGVLRPSKTTLVLLGVVVLIAALAGVSYLVYGRWLLPARTMQDQLGHVRGLHELARGYMAAGEYARAADIYEEILAQVPGDGTAATGLERAETLQQLAAAYDSALELTRQERWEEALEAWEAILTADPNFRDAAEWAIIVEQENLFGSLLKDAEARHQSGDWEGAIGTLDRLRGQDSSYRRDEVETLLASSLVNQAEETLGEADDPAGVYDEVIQLLGKAIAIRPQDASLLTERELAEAYVRGFSRLEEADCEGAVEDLRLAYEHDPSYAGGKVVDLLYRANVDCGDQRAAAKDYRGALSYYEAARELSVADASEASTKYAAVVPVLTATPTPRRPSPTATSTRRPAPTPTWSPYRFAYVDGSAQPLTRPGCQAPSIEGRVVDAAGQGLGGLWVRLEWWGNHKDYPTDADGSFGFAPLSWEYFSSSVPFRLTVIRSPGNPAPLSPPVPLEFQGCSVHDWFTNVTFKALE